MLEICGHVCSKSSPQIWVIFLQSSRAALVQAPHKWLGQQAGGLMDQHSRRREARSFRLLARGGWGVDFEIKSWARKKVGMHEEWQQ